jgi:hypothetical protein
LFAPTPASPLSEYLEERASPLACLSSTPRSRIFRGKYFQGSKAGRILIPLSALGQKQTYALQKSYVRFTPNSDRDCVSMAVAWCFLAFSFNAAT